MSRVSILVGLVIGLSVIAYLFWPVTNHPSGNYDRNHLINLVNAVHMYALEYGELPIPKDSTSDVTVETAGEFLAVLQGENRNDLNPREKVFFEAHDAYQGRGGQWLNPLTGEPELLDHYGRRFVMVVDGDGDDMVVPPNESESIRKRVVGIGAGRDADDSSDDVRTWR